MLIRTAVLLVAILVAATNPGLAGERSFHLFGGRYVLDFPGDYVFVKRINASADRQGLSFKNGNKDIAITGVTYRSSDAEPLVSHDAYKAQMEAEKAYNLKYVNDESRDGKRGRHLLGSCIDKDCLYQVAKAIPGQIWLSIVVACRQCSDQDIADVGALSESLYAQVDRLK